MLRISYNSLEYAIDQCDVHTRTHTHTHMHTHTHTHIKYAKCYSSKGNIAGGSYAYSPPPQDKASKTH